MAVMVDANVFIHFERRGVAIDLSLWDPSHQGRLIGAHDMIIAATALHHKLPLLTDNVEEFSRVAGLSVIPFGP